MVELDKVRKAISAQNAAEVAAHAGVSRQAVYYFASGQTADPRYSFVVSMIDFLRDRRVKIQ